MAKVNLSIKILVDNLNIRSGPNTSSAATGKTLSKNQTVTVTEKNDSSGWYKLSDGRGWISGGSSYVKVVSTQDASKTPAKSKTPEVKKVASTSKSGGLEKSIVDMLYAASGTKGGKNEIDASTRLFGGPHQFLSQTDFRVSDGNFQLGRKYMQTMVSEAPIVYLMPGKPNYLPDMDADQRDAFTQYISGKDVENKSVLNDIMGNKDHRYYSFLTDYATYMRYVNILCRWSSIYIGLGDSYAPGTKTPYKKYDWSNYRYQSSFGNKTNKDQTGFFNMEEIKTDMYNGLFGNYQYVQFWVDPSSSFSESTSNNTSQSKVEGFFDTAEGIVKELAFMMDAGAISNNGEALQKFSGGIDEINKSLSGKNENFFSRLLGMSSTVLSGSNMLFPQIWGDSINNKSYNITINLESPYGDKESIYINTIVPLMHLIALSVPRQTTANSYASPFMVRAFAKGWFSCDMGIVQDISIEKGGRDAWTVDGLPSQIKVNMTIKDLYTNLMITPNSKPGLFFQNTGLIDFLSVTCGVDITKPQFQMQLDAMVATLTNAVTDIPANISRDVVQSLRNQMEVLYKLQ